MATPEQSEFEAEIAAAIASSPRIAVFKMELGRMVPEKHHEMFGNLLNLAFQWTYAEGMRAGSDWLVRQRGQR